MHAIRRFFVNILCAFIPNKPMRKKTRVLLNSDFSGCLRFIKRDLNKKKIGRVKTYVGYLARSLIISVNDEYVYKFPLRRDNSNDLALREKRIVDSLKRVSPMHIPDVQLLKWKKNIVRKYECIPGVTLSQMGCDDVLSHVDVWAPQIAKFIYDVACADPVKIRDLKPSKNDKPAYRVGWCQGDIADNFIVNPNTFEIVAFIDWEDAAFGDFSYVFTKDKRSPRIELMAAVSHEYDKFYNANKK